MRVIEHQRILERYNKRKINQRLLRWSAVIVALALISFGVLNTFLYMTVADSVVPDTKRIAFSTGQPQYAWPGYGQSAIGELEQGVIAQHGDGRPRPTASVAKAMTALAIVRKKPLQPKSQGETLQLTTEDVVFYDQYIAKNGAVVRVANGEKITQYQGLQAMLLPSANNMADTMATWAFGSVQKYTDYANTLAVSLGMKSTTIADASGFSEKTVSTASDLVVLAQAVLKEPVLAEIISQSTATIPVHGTIRNVNSYLGEDGINGIKTGNTDAAGGCFLVSATRKMSDGSTKTLIAVILGAPTRPQAMNDSLPLLDQAQTSYKKRVLAAQGAEVGYYHVPWSGRVAAVLKEDMSLYAWPGTTGQLKVEMSKQFAGAPTSAVVGEVVATVNKTAVKTAVQLKQDIPEVSTEWRKKSLLL